MPDLVKNFFEKDLTETEDKALEGLLLSSEEEAFRFGDMAIENYGRFGLPEPRWPRSGSYPFARRKRVSRWLIPWFALLGTAAFAAGVPSIRHTIHRVLTAAVQMVFVPTPLPTPRPLSIPTMPVPTPLPKATVTPLPSPTKTPTPLPPVSAPPPLGAPALSPVPLGTQTPGHFSSLSITVRQPEEGTLVVRVLDSNGNEVKVLHEGNLKPGNWVFKWDGRLQNGAPAGPGNYQIEVKSGTATQHKDVVVR